MSLWIFFIQFGFLNTTTVTYVEQTKGEAD